MLERARCKSGSLSARGRAIKLLATAMLVIASCVLANADTITFVTPVGSTAGGLPVNAEATFTTGAGTLMITLTNLLANPKSVVQAISDLAFVLSNGATSGTIAASSGQEIMIAADGTFTLGSGVATGWALNSTASGLQLTVVGTPTAPTHTIIGPPDGSNLYSNANNSIAGNIPHNPFLNQFATFILDIPGVTADTTITSATFSFGTAAGTDVPGTPIPEPTSLLLFGSGLLGLAVAARRKLVS